jgi:hypothetical protein
MTKLELGRKNMQKEKLFDDRKQTRRRRPNFGKRYIPKHKTPLPIEDYIDAFGRKDKAGRENQK